jgi:hypothetical protein
VCEGYKKNFKWKSFEEASFTGKPAGKPRKSAWNTGAIAA